MIPERQRLGTDIQNPSYTERVRRAPDFYDNCGTRANNPYYLLYQAAQEAGIDIRIKPDAIDDKGVILQGTVAVYCNRQTITLLRTIIDSPKFGIIRDALRCSFYFDSKLAEQEFAQEAAFMLARTIDTLLKTPVTERTDEKLQKIIPVYEIKALLKEIIQEQVDPATTTSQQSV